MGQYYEVINITKKEQIENNNCGWKLMEFSYVGNRRTDQLWVALSDEWKNDTVLVCGDYYSSDDANCNPCAAEMERLAGVEPGCLCDYADENYKECDFDTSKVPNYAINPNTKQYVNRNHAQLEGCYTEGSEKKAVTYGYFIDPLSLLLTAGNGQGGGDYEGNNIDLVGSWVKDSQAVYTVYQKSEIPADYTELIPDFIEDRYSNVPNLRKDDPALKEFFAKKTEEYKKKQHTLHSLSDGGMNASMETLVRELGKYLKKQMIQFDNSDMIKKELDIFTTMNHLKNISFDYYSSYSFSCEKPGLKIYTEIPMEYGTPYNVSLAHIIFSKRKTGELYNVLSVEYSFNKKLSIQNNIDFETDRCNAKITEENKKRKAQLNEVINGLKKYDVSANEIQDRIESLEEEKEALSKLSYNCNVLKALDIEIPD